MKLLPYLIALLSAASGFGQDTKSKPPKAKTPAETIIGVWKESTATGEEFATFTADGRLIMQRGSETMKMTYKLDTSTKPWKIDLTFPKGTIYAVFEFPGPEQFLLAPPNPDKEKRPDAAALKNTKSIMTRVTLGANGGIHEVVEGWLKKLAGTWEGKDGSATVTLTFTAEGAYTMKTADITDKGRFRIDTTKTPVAVDLLSNAGAGAKYSIVEFTADDQLRVGSSVPKADERQTAFDDLTAKTYKKKKATPAKPK